MNKSLKTIIIVVILILIIVSLFIFLNKSKNFSSQKTNSGCPTCATVEQIGLIRACKCPFGTELKKDIFNKTYCAQKTYKCSTNWRACESRCPSQDSIECDGSCFFPTDPG